MRNTPNFGMTVKKMFFPFVLTIVTGYFLQKILFYPLIAPIDAPELTKNGLEILSYLFFFIPIFSLFLSLELQKQKTTKEASLRESERIYRQLFESNMDTALIINRQGIIVDVNYAIEGSGYKREELIGKHFSHLVVPEDLKKVEVHFEQVLNGQTVRYEARGLNKEGGPLHVVITSLPVYQDGNITGHFAFIRDITEQKAQLETIRKLAYYDTLTGLPNRHFFTETFQANFLAAEKHNKNLALMFLDLDGMKRINDTLGHDAGDQFLQLASGRLQKVAEDHHAFLARIGGDEFTVIIPEYASIEAVTSVAQALVASFSEPFQIEGNIIQSKTSVGVALYPEHGVDMRAIMRAADVAMFKAKKEGGHLYKFYKQHE